MEDKTFELMEKMYIEFNKKFGGLETDMKNGFNQVNQKLDEKADKSDIARLENDLKPKAETALDGYKIVYEKLQELQTDIREVSKKVETQEVELRVIKNIK